MHPFQLFVPRPAPFILPALLPYGDQPKPHRPPPAGKSVSLHAAGTLRQSAYHYPADPAGTARYAPPLPYPAGLRRPGKLGAPRLIPRRGAGQHPGEQAGTV